jgi:uncharacterized protein (DUF952 family)
MGNNLIYHVVNVELWKNIQEKAEIRPEDLGESEFVHCCTHGQIGDVLEKWFPGQTGLLAMEINTELLAADVVYENLEGGEDLFPHVYGVIPRYAITNVIKIKENQ